MTTFFIDLWHDLREKRLWPVAVGLLAATVAVPVVLFKPAGGSTVTPAPVVAPAANAGPSLPAVSVSDGPTEGSKLQTFTQKNPFQPMKDLAQTGSTAPSPSASSSLKSISSLSGGASGTSGGTSAGGGTGHSAAPTGGAPSGSSTPQVTQHSTTTSWTYAPTIKFGTPDKMETKHDLTPFTLLPSADKPAIIFASADATHAVFYIQDKSFQPQGEGKCDKPDTGCTFVTLSTSDSGNEEAFVSADGTQEYDVELVSIKRKTLDPSAKGASKGKGKDVSGAAHRAAVMGDTLLPVLLGFSSTTTTTARKK